MPKKSDHGGARPGSGRKPLDEATVPVTNRIRPSLIAKLDKWCKSNGLTRSQAITEAIRRLVGK